jgi:hypothetical protein
MTRVTHGLISHVYFGFGPEHLFVRLDTEGAARQRLATIDDVLIRFIEPNDVTLTVTALEAAAPAVTLRRGGRKGSKTPIAAALGDILEVACPLADLRINAGDKVGFVIDLVAKRQSVERAPSEGEITLTVPSADYEARMWQA